MFNTIHGSKSKYLKNNLNITKEPAHNTRSSNFAYFIPNVKSFGIKSFFYTGLFIDAIKELSPNSAAGPDGIPAALLINGASEIAPLLKRIFTSSFSKGYIKPSFKRAAIVPIFKSGDKCLPGNYKPISLTSVICKVYERIIRKQVFSFLCDKNCLSRIYS